ncbi:hypothetical protein BC941DRAFT_506499 [Chlamydoabsidia padenii]|nr:hypothetical protein BC941DRAFT_506499 [Chlamydoabsidia padenii]
MNCPKVHYSQVWINWGTLSVIIHILSLIPLYPMLYHLSQTTETHMERLCAQVNASINNIPVLFQQHLQRIHQSIVRQLGQAMMGIVSIIHVALLWFVDMYKSTYRCLIVFAIQSLLGVLTRLTAPIQAVADSVLTTINDTLFDHDHPIFTHLSNWTQSMEETQIRLNQWTNGTDPMNEWLSGPFDALKQHINATFSNQHVSTMDIVNNNTTTYCDPIPVIEEVRTVYAKIIFSLNIAMGVLFGALILCMLANLVRLRYHHHHHHQSSVQPTKTCLGVAVVGLCTHYYLLLFATHVITTTTGIQRQQSILWNTTNQWIAQSETMINDQLFASVRAFAVPISSTLDSVINHLSDLIKDTVGGTLMETPAKQVLDCLVLNKLDTLQDGVKWIIDSGGVELPRIQAMPLFPTPQLNPSIILDAFKDYLQSKVYIYWVLFIIGITSVVINAILTKRIDPNSNTIIKSSMK